MEENRPDSIDPEPDTPENTGAAERPQMECAASITAEGLQEAILALGLAPIRPDGKIRFPLCPNCRCPYNIPTHPADCHAKGGTEA